MADHEQSESLPDGATDDTSETDDATDTASETPDESTTDADPLESTSVEETPESKRPSKPKSNTTFAGRNAVRAAGLVAGLGVFLFWGPVLFTGFGLAMWAQFGLALVITVAASVTAMKHGTDAASAIGLPLLAAVMGVLVVALPFLMDVHSLPLQWANVIAGSTIVVLALLVIFGFRKDAAADNGFGSPTR